MNDRQSARLAQEMHHRILERIPAVRANKVEVYRLLAEFKRRRLYRLLDLPIARRHAANICAGRRFSTWEDYLAGLGGGAVAGDDGDGGEVVARDARDVGAWASGPVGGALFRRGRFSEHVCAISYAACREHALVFAGVIFEDHM